MAPCRNQNKLSIMGNIATHQVTVNYPQFNHVMTCRRWEIFSHLVDRGDRVSYTIAGDPLGPFITFTIKEVRHFKNIHDAIRAIGNDEKQILPDVADLSVYKGAVWMARVGL